MQALACHAPALLISLEIITGRYYRSIYFVQSAVTGIQSYGLIRCTMHIINTDAYCISTNISAYAWAI